MLRWLCVALLWSTAWAAGPGWLHDDYPTARAQAQARGHLLVVDLWAPWCHTCLSMQDTVLRDPRLRDRPGVTWLALDTDRPQNRAPVERLAPTVWPTFVVIDPINNHIMGRLQGAASVAQFTAFLDAAEGHSPVTELVREGDRFAASGRFAQAEAAYAQALAGAPDAWPRRPGVLVDQISARAHLGDPAGCAELGLAALDQAVVGHTPSAADFVGVFARCATQLDRTEALAAGIRRAAARLERVHADPEASLSVDDRSELLRILRDLYWAIGEHAHARQAAVRQAQLLEEAAAQATPRQAMTYGWPRAEVHQFLGWGWRLEPKLAAVAEALPDEYDPAYRLAWLRFKLHRYAEARTAAEHALSKVYGRRTLRVLKLLADVQTAAGDHAAAKTTWRQLLAAAEAERDTPSTRALVTAAQAALAR